MKTAPHDIVHEQMTMQAIMDETIGKQLTEYAVMLLQEDRNRRLTGHVIFSIGSTHVVSKTRFFECNARGQVVFRNDKNGQWKIVDLSQQQPQPKKVCCCSFVGVD